MPPRRTPRRRPKQARAQATIEAILEAAAQILEKHDEAAFTTNRIAEKAGVSIGTLYQYFPDKQAILLAINSHEMARLHEEAHAFYGAAHADSERLLLRQFIYAFKGRPKLRRAAVRAAVMNMTAGAMGKSIEASTRAMPPYEKVSQLDAFVMTRAVTGVVRAAVLEDSEFLFKPEFEEALLTLTKAYRSARMSRQNGSVRRALPKSARDRASPFARE